MENQNVPFFIEDDLMDAPMARRGVRWYWRIPGKILIFALVVALVEFPNPAVLLRHFRHVSNLGAMIDPHAPELAPLEAEVRARLGLADGPHAATGLVYVGRGVFVRSATPSGKSVLQGVERFIYETVSYDWDWNVWGVADYMPTVAEMFARARQYPDGRIREDCDGRAVMAASLLRRLGYPAELVTDFGHVWVQTRDRGRPVEIMGPGRGKAVVSARGGNQFNWSGLAHLPRALAYGISVFPWVREAIVYLTLMVLLAHRRMSVRSAAVGALLAFAGWHLLRSNDDYWGGSMTSAWLGLAYVAGGCWVMASASRRARRTIAAQAAEQS